jgi:hypothetical protein
VGGSQRDAREHHRNREGIGRQREAAAELTAACFHLCSHPFLVIRQGRDSASLSRSTETHCEPFSSRAGGQHWPTWILPAASLGGDRKTSSSSQRRMI